MGCLCQTFREEPLAGPRRCSCGALITKKFFSTGLLAIICTSDGWNGRSAGPWAAFIRQMLAQQRAPEAMAPTCNRPLR